MALIGPMVVVAESSAADLIDVLAAAGAFPVVETPWSHAPAAIVEIQPVALAIADPDGKPSARHTRAVAQCIEARGGPIMPVVALVERDGKSAFPGALPITLDDSTERLVARLRSALRIRTMHATVLRRARAIDPTRQITVPANLLADATVLCVGRGASYPALSVAIGERVGLIGAFSVETGARYLNVRDIDGVVIGDGLGARAVDAFAVLNNSACDDERLPNLIRVEGDHAQLVERILAFVRMQAFENHLKRMLKSLDSSGGIDPHTGLLQVSAFWRDLGRAVEEAGEAGSALSVARFSLEGVGEERAHIDAARLFSRLVRNVDFACREQDGSILAAFTGTDLRSAHLVARRIASVLRQTMISPGHDRHAIRPTITLASLKPTDNMSSLVARVGAYPKIAVAR